MNSTRLFYLFILLWLCVTATAAGGLPGRIRKAIDKGKLEKAEELILKSLRKDTLNPGARYFYSVIFSDTAFVRFDIDSARLFINGALEDYAAASVDHLKDLRKLQVTKSTLEEQKRLVTLLAFGRAADQMTLPVFEQFLEDFPDAEMLERAIVLRDSLAFVMARAEDTWQAYKKYFEAYPTSAYAGVATERYQVLIFKDYTKDDRLESYVRFLDEHPETPFRRTAEEIIFRRSTIDHKWASYTGFLKKYPKSHLRKKIGDILYYMTRTSADHAFEEVLKYHPNADSLRRIHDLQAAVFFPVLDHDKFGFWSTEGEEIISMKFTHVPERYLCGNILDDWLEVGQDGDVQVISRNGEVVLKGIKEVRQTGPATLLVAGREATLYHKSGFPIVAPVTDAVELNNGWIAFREKDKWGVVSPAGFEILPADFESIEPAGAFIILERDGLFAFTNEEQLVSGKTDFQFVCDDYEVINDTLLQGFGENRECLYDQHMSMLVPLDTHSIYVSNSFWYIKSAAGYRVLDVKDKELIDQWFQYLEVNDGWLAVKKKEGWMLISRKKGGHLPLNALDSVKLISDQAAFLKQGDTFKVVFQNGQEKKLPPDEVVRVLTPDRSSANGYLLFSSEGHQKVLDRSGVLLFESKYNEVSLLADTLFRFRKKDKVGVLLRSGEVLIPAEYSLVDESGGMLFLLRGKKIGGYDLASHTLISPDYEAKIEKAGSLYQVQWGGKQGMVNNRNEIVIPTVYDRFMHWNDTSIWAKTAGEWKLLDLKGNVLREGVLSLDHWLQGQEESLAIVLEAGGYGLVSSKNGVVLMAQYNEIINVGSPDTPVIFAEQHLKEAAFFVVTYFDRKGEVIRSQAFRPEEYDRIYCDR